MFVPLDVVSLFTNVPLKKTVDIILKRIYTDKEITVTFTKRSLKLVSAIFYQIFIFSPNDSPSKAMKNVFYFI